MGFDSCHLKLKYLGMLLSTTTLDENKGLFHVAFAIVEIESEDTWLWFIKHLNNSFKWCLCKVVVISIMDKGLLAAMSKLLP